MMLDFEEANRVLDEQDGVLTWKINPSKALKAGQVAGYTDKRNKKGYVWVRYKGTLYLAHRIVWLLHHGEWPDGQIDHINHNGFDNRISNLRVVSDAENKRNTSKSSRNKSGHLGVSWDKITSKWFACIRVDGKTKYLGQFEEIQNAVAARKAADRLYGFHENHGS